MKKALIFDCDGVLADTEQFGHLPAFNQMWRELGIDWEWSAEAYGLKLQIGGGKERMLSLFKDDAFLKVFTPPESEEEQKALVAEWHKRKSAIYKEIIFSGKIPPRSGVRRLAEEALDQGWLVAIASTSAKPSVEAVAHRTLGEKVEKGLSLLLAGDVVKAKKPAPDIYNLAAKELDLSPSSCVVIEDSRNGLLAALGAGMHCVVTVSPYTVDEDFTGADMVLTSLGDPGGEQCKVLRNAGGAAPGDCLTLQDLEKVLEE